MTYVKRGRRDPDQSANVQSGTALVDPAIFHLSAVALNLGLPDLRIEDITWSPTNPVAGDHVVFSAVVKNYGTALPPGNPLPTGPVLDVLFRWGVGGVNTNVTNFNQTWSDTFTAGLASGASTTLTANGGDATDAPAGRGYWLAVEGTFVVEAGVNLVNRYAEQDTTNNFRNESITVGPAGGIGGPGSPADNAVGLRNSYLSLHLGVAQCYFTAGGTGMNTLTDELNGNLGNVLGLVGALGGGNYFTGDPTATFDANDGRGGAEYAWQAAIVDNGWVAQATAHGKETYLGHYLITASEMVAAQDSFMMCNPFSTPSMNQWLTDYPGSPIQLWKAGKWMGCVGPFFDGEPYSHWRHDFAWNSIPGNHAELNGQGRTEQDVRNAFYNFGAAMGAALVSAYGGSVKIAQYVNSDGCWPAGWMQAVSLYAYGPGGFDHVYFQDWVDGMFSNAGISSWHFYDASCQKGPQISGTSIEYAMQWGAIDVYSWASRTLHAGSWANFLRAASYSSQVWPDSGQTSFERQLGAPEFEYHMQGSNQGGGRGHNVYPSNWPNTGDIQPHSGTYDMYYPGFDLAVVTGTMDSTLPSLSSINVTRNGTGINVTARGDHPRGCIGVSWVQYQADGTTVVKSGALPHTYTIDSGTRGVDLVATHINPSGTIPVVPINSYLDLTLWSIHHQCKTVRTLVSV